MKNRLLTLMLMNCALLVAACAPGVETTESSGGKGPHGPGDRTDVQPVTSVVTTSEDSATSETKTSETRTSENKTSETKTSTVVTSNGGGTSIDIPVDSKWNVNFNEYGNNFRSTLERLITSKRTKTTTYSNCLSLGAKAAAYPAGSSTFVPFYHDQSLTATQSQCNREHTWPNSRGTGESGPGADPFIIRPTLSSENSSRGNKFYGNEKSSEWDPASCGFEAARGESARVILYCATAYHTAKGFELSNNPGDATSLKTMGTLKTLLKWNAAYAPTTIEKQINEYLSENGYGRNPFVDHPEYADYIWDANGVRNSSPTGTVGGGEDTPTEPAKEYNLVKALADIENAKVAIVSSSATTGPWMALTSLPKSDSLPWYITGVQTTLSSDKSKMTCDSTSLGMFDLQKQADGKYKIHHETAGYLNNYVDGTHYSICWGKPSSYTTTSELWEITIDQTGACVFKGEQAWLEYYKDSWCGYSKAPSVGIYLYK